MRNHFWPVDAVLVFMRERSWLANGAMLETVASKSKSKPLTKEEPKGRRALELACFGPNVAQMRFASETAADEDEKPPSV